MRPPRAKKRAAKAARAASTAKPAPPAGSTRPPTTFQATYSAYGLAFEVSSPSDEIARGVDFIYREMRADPAPTSAPRIEIRPKSPGSSELSVAFAGEPWFEAVRIGDLLHQLDNQLTVALEHGRPDLYFVHSAALELDGQATLLVGDSGAGKSTTCYALCASSVGYLSDELAAIEPETGRVLPYPRAICLKRDPPAPLRLPDSSFRTEWTLHTQASDLGSRIARDGALLSRILFVRWSASHAKPLLRPISRGEAALRLYQGALNQLAHPAFGLDDTLRLIERSECFELLSAGIEETVALVRGASHATR